LLVFAFIFFSAKLKGKDFAPGKNEQSSSPSKSTLTKQRNQQEKWRFLKEASGELPEQKRSKRVFLILFFSQLFLLQLSDGHYNFELFSLVFSEVV
jgi:hypothetical protein